MKNVNKLALLISLGSLLPLAASAKTLEQSYLDSCRKGPGIPTPISVVSPQVQPEDIGQAVEVEFVVDTTGHTSDVSVKSASDRALARAVVDAVKQWRFTPAQRDGAAVTTKVVLPVRVVQSGKVDGSLAMN
jgi:TonB family protein